MTSAARSATLLLALAMTSACARPEHPKIVSDFCLNDRVLSFDLASAAAQDDPGNRYDSERTVTEIIAHNAVHRRLCGGR